MCGGCLSRAPWREKIVLENDTDWPGGRFSAGGVGCPNEWTVVNKTRTHLPRSGLFLGVLRAFLRACWILMFVRGC
jgi:hypothetical protein